MLTTFAWPTQAQISLPELIERQQKSVVTVGTMRPAKRTQVQRPPVTFRGSGFVVGDGSLVITNAHVLPKPEDLDTDNDEKIAVFQGQGEKGRGIAVEVLRRDDAHDLAVLKMPTRLPAMMLADDDLEPAGTEVAITGFPIVTVLGLYPATHRGIIAAKAPIVLPVTHARALTPDQIRQLRKPFMVYQLDMVAFPGNSGSAVYRTADGRVIGVVNSVFVKGTKEAALSAPSGITYAIPTSYVRELIRGL